MNRLLGIFIDTILPLIILIIGIVAAIIIYRKTSKKFKKLSTPSPKKNTTPQVTIKKNYCTEEEMKFLEALHKALPRDCISFPHVGLAKLIEPKNNMVDFKEVSNKHVDICVFLRNNMQPILVIDLDQQSPDAQHLKKFDSSITNILKEVKIPIIHKQIENQYNINELKMEVLKSLDSAVITYLKDITLDVFDKK